MIENNIDRLIPLYLANSKNYSVAVTDLDGNFTYVNSVFQKAFGFLKINLIGEHFQLTVHSDDIHKCVVAAQGCLDHPGKVYQLQIRNPADILEDFYLTNWEFSLLLDDGKHPLGILCIGSDVTEVARVNLQVRQFSKKVDVLVEEITDGFYMLNHQWEFVKINSTAEKIIGIPSADLLGRKLWDVLPDNFYRDNYVSNFYRAMQDRVTLSFEDYQPNFQLWFNVICYPSHEGLTVFFKNINAEKQIQKDLQESQFKLKAILDSSTDSNILINSDYKILCFNKQASEVSKAVFGRIMAEFDDMWYYVHDRNKEDFYKSSQLAFGGTSLKFERELYLNDTSTWFELSYFPVYATDGSILGVSFNLVNIQARKESEIKMLQSEMMLRSLYNSGIDAKIFIDKELKILFINDQARQVTEHLSGKVATVGDHALDFYRDELKAEYKVYYEKVLNDEEVLLERENDGLWWLISLDPVHDKDNKIVGISQNMKNITLEKHSDLKIHQQNEKLKTIAWQQGHEVRGPLSNILGLCDLVINNPDLASESNSQYLKYIKQSSQKLDEIIQAIIIKTTDGE